MAILSPADLATIRRAVTSEGEVNWTKPVINAALQAIEDQWEADRPRFANAIETAAPGVFTNAQKNRLGKHWLTVKFRLGG